MTFVGDCGFLSKSNPSDSGKMSAPESRSVKVRRMVEEVEEALRTESAAQVSSRFAEFQKDFPKIFEMVLTRTYPREILEMMLKQLEKMESGSLSQHNASVAVGGVLVDRFVKPQLEGKPKTA
jgi:hypothetical protein